MSFVSYAQNMEDVLLWRALRDQAPGIYVDVGANDPNVFSVSRHFHIRGWRGVHVEPVPAFAALLRTARPGDEVIEAALSNSTNKLKLIDFPGTGLSTSDEAIAQKHIERGFKSEEIEVETRTLASVLDTLPADDIHWLKIDVEGAEKDVLESWGESNRRPWILVIESTLPNSQVESFQDWEPIVLEKGYRFAYFDGLNRYYVHETHKRLARRLAVQPNVFDAFELPMESAFTQEIAEQYRQSRTLLDRQAHHFTISLQDALYAQAAEASDNRVRLDAELADTRHKLGRAVEEVRDVHLRLQATIGQERERTQQLAEANEEIKNTHLRLQDALGQEMERSSQLAAANAEIRDVHLRLQASLGQQQELAAALTAERKTNMALRNVVAGLRRQSEQTRKALLDDNAILRGELETETQRGLQLREEISQAFRNSFSWRLTAPVRALTSGARAAVAQGREAARTLLKGTLHILRAYPALKTPVLALLSVNPPLKERLTNFGQRHRPPGEIVAPKPETSFLLTPEPGKVEIWAQVLQHSKAIPTAGKPT